MQNWYILNWYDHRKKAEIGGDVKGWVDPMDDATKVQLKKECEAYIKQSLYFQIHSCGCIDTIDDRREAELKKEYEEVYINI